jgi:hypothetical protein
MKLDVNKILALRAIYSRETGCPTSCPDGKLFTIQYTTWLEARASNTEQNNSAVALLADVYRHIETGEIKMGCLRGLKHDIAVWAQSPLPPNNGINLDSPRLPTVNPSSEIDVGGVGIGPRGCGDID